jgi:hypothetical protein
MLGSHFKYTKGLKPKDYSKDKSEFAEAKITLVHNILFALEEKAIHQCFKPEDPGTVSNPHQFGPRVDSHKMHIFTINIFIFHSRYRR